MPQQRKLVSKKVYASLPKSAQKVLSAASSPTRSYARVGGARIRGSGGYFTDTVKKYWPSVRPVLKKIGKYAVSTAAGAVPGIGAVLSPAAGALWDSLIGSGAYAPVTYGVKNNSFMKQITANGPPSMWTNNKQSFVFRHKEYLGSVVSSATSLEFKVDTYPIQPSNKVTFPWLSGMAPLFQEYKVKGMVFEFQSASGDALNGTNTALGTVMLATNYNAGQAPFATKQQLASTDFVSMCKPSMSCIHPIECAPQLTANEMLYVNPTSVVPAGEDIKSYNLGLFQVASVGIQGSSVVIGDLWCSYEIEFYKATLTPNGSIDSQAFYSRATNPVLFFGGWVDAYKNNIRILPYNIAGSVGGIKFLDGVAGEAYLVDIQWVGASTASVIQPSLSYNGCTTYNLFSNYTNNLHVNQGSLTTTILNLTILVKITQSASPANVPNIVLNGGVIPSTVTSAEILVTRINPAMNNIALGESIIPDTAVMREQEFTKEFEMLKLKYQITDDESDEDEQAITELPQKYIDEDFVRMGVIPNPPVQTNYSPGTVLQPQQQIQTQIRTSHVKK